MRQLFASTFLVALTLVNTGSLSFAAEKITGVVELFTSQGCSSCPPADKILTKLNQEPGLLVLAWHVDYWDYLGWKDTLGVTGATERQRGYAANFQSASVYTPQAVVNGATGMVGSKERQIRTAIKSVPFPAFDVKLRQSGDGVTVSLPAAALNGTRAVVEMINFEPSAVVEIERGENAGESVIYQNAVRNFTEIGQWDGTAITLKATAPRKTLSSAVLVRTILSTGEAGPVIGAAVLDPL